MGAPRRRRGTVAQRITDGGAVPLGVHPLLTRERHAGREPLLRPRRVAIDQALTNHEVVNVQRTTIVFAVLLVV